MTLKKELLHIVQVLKKAGSEEASDKRRSNDEAEEAEYKCQEDDVVYMYRKCPDVLASYNAMDSHTDTWQECQKKCGEIEQCKGFTWHKETSHCSKHCSLF